MQTHTQSVKVFTYTMEPTNYIFIDSEINERGGRMIVNIGMLTEVCPFCGECLWEEWGFWECPEDFHWGAIGFDVLSLLD